MTQVLMDAAAVEAAVERIVDALVTRPGDGPFAVVGIRRGGESLAKRVAQGIEARGRGTPALGMVDITLYRDDGFGPNDFPKVGVTEIPFELTDHTVVLVDDVLYTGRTVRAAIDAILDYGRPKAVRLAVLVDRGLRELPIGADAAGYEVETAAGHHVDVRVSEVPHRDDEVRITRVQGADS
ncbi:MAG: bifunctional pyr operon transcriptional regulator/uracil phosphoribosyltransferase PyrR [Myxococcota bacterium]